MGNPLSFLESCRKCLKKGGTLKLLTDNADYFRYHFFHRPVIGFFGAYHATLWEQNDRNIQTQHKMFFQARHLETLLKIAGFRKPEIKFFHRTNLDCLLPERFGAMYIKAEAKK